MATRHQARMAVVGFLYAYDIGNKNIINMCDYILEERKIKNRHKDFAKDIFQGTLANLDLIDKYILNNLKGWDYKSIGKVEKSILRLATYEMLIEKRAYNIVINEAVELAKELSDDKSPQFINAILDSILKEANNLNMKDKKINETIQVEK